MEIASQMEEKKDMRKSMIYLQKIWNFDQACSKDLSTVWNEGASNSEENPYRLADDIEGVGFRTADEIAARIGIHTDSDYRIRSGLFYILQQAVAEGISICLKNYLRRGKGSAWN